MQLPTFQKKSPLRASDLNNLVDSLRRTRILPGVGIKLTETINGTVVSLKPSRSFGGGSSTEPRPWDIINLRGVGQPDAQGKFSTYKAEIWPGTVAGILPDNIFSGSEPATFTFPSAMQKWKVKITSDGKQPTGATIIVSASDPAPQTLAPSALPPEAEFVFAITVDGAAFRTIGNGNPLLGWNQVVVTDKTSSPPPGVPGVDRWYRFNFS